MGATGTLSTSAKMGTVELTGFEMMRKHALGQLLEHCSAIPFTIEAFVLNRSSLDDKTEQKKKQPKKQTNRVASTTKDGLLL